MSLRRITDVKRLFSATLKSRSFSSTGKLSSLFYEVGGAAAPIAGSTVVGEMSSGYVLDLKKARPGDVIEVPYELTINQSFRDFWQSCFHGYDRINTSTPFSRALGLQDQVVPFGMMLFLAGSMSHAYDIAKSETNYTNAKYHWPGECSIFLDIHISRCFTNIPVSQLL
jgi:hypothetical protein